MARIIPKVTFSHPRARDGGKKNKKKTNVINFFVFLCRQPQFLKASKTDCKQMIKKSKQKASDVITVYRSDIHPYYNSSVWLRNVIVMRARSIQEELHHWKLRGLGIIWNSGSQILENFMDILQIMFFLWENLGAWLLYKCIEVRKISWTVSSLDAFIPVICCYQHILRRNCCVVWRMKWPPRNQMKRPSRLWYMHVIYFLLKKGHF